MFLTGFIWEYRGFYGQGTSVAVAMSLGYILDQLLRDEVLKMILLAAWLSLFVGLVNY